MDHGKKKDVKGKCSLCGIYNKLTFEHVPPRAALNNRPIFVQNFFNLIERNSPFFGKKRRSHNGFGQYTLCKECNNQTGGWYARDFASFVHQGMSQIYLPKVSGELIEFKLFIKPLNVLKQILTMFLSADKTGTLQANDTLVKFILNKHSKNFPPNINVHLYCTLSPNKRMMGYSFIMDPSKGFQKCSEINFNPFGYFLTDESFPPREDMIAISKFSHFDYDQKVLLSTKLPYLKVEVPWIGIYGK